MRPADMHRARASKGSASATLQSSFIWGYWKAASLRAAPKFSTMLLYWASATSQGQWPICLFCLWGATRPSGGPNAAQSVSFSCTIHFQSVSPAAAASGGAWNLPRTCPVAASSIHRVGPSAKTTSLPVATLATLCTT